MPRPWMPLYVADYLADTAHLRAAESGAYLHLIMHYWQHGSLPADDVRLARIARMTPKEWAGTRDLISLFFEGGWVHKRIEFELAEAEKAYERRANAGKLGGKAKAMRQQKSSIATALQKQPLPQPQDSSNELSKTRAKRASQSGDLELEFEQTFWPQWPNKVGKSEALKAFLRIRKTTDLQQILTGLRRYIETKPADRSWLNPATFLNGKRFDDQPAPAPPARAGPGRRDTNGWTDLSRELNGRADGQQPHADSILDLKPTGGAEPRIVGSSRVDAEPSRAPSERRGGDPRDGAPDLFRAPGAGRASQPVGDVFEPRRPFSEGPRRLADVLNLPVRSTGSGGGG